MGLNEELDERGKLRPKPINFDKRSHNSVNDHRCKKKIQNNEEKKIL